MFKEWWDSKSKSEQNKIKALTLVTLSTAIISGIVYTIGRESVERDTDKMSYDLLTEHVKSNAQIIDEDIFTKIAPWIENNVLTKGVDESVFETTYDVTDGVMKKVVVKVIEDQVVIPS